MSPGATSRTTLLSVQPRYDYRDGKAPTLVGYDLANVVEVTVRDLATLGAVVDGALAAGATSLDGLAFRVEDPREAERAARTAAVAQARARAEVLAAAADVALAGVSDIVEGGPPPAWPHAEGRPAHDGRRRRDAGRGRHDRDRGHGDGHLPDRLTVRRSRAATRSAARSRQPEQLAACPGSSRRRTRPRPRRSRSATGPAGRRGSARAGHHRPGRSPTGCPSSRRRTGTRRRAGLAAGRGRRPRR